MLARKITAAAIAAAVLVTPAKAAKTEHAPKKIDLYPSAGIVIEIDYKNDRIKIVTCSGIPYYYEGADDWSLYDGATMTMSNNGTKNVYDDEIKAARYFDIFELANMKK